jgi:hypothetical protein
MAADRNVAFNVTADDDDETSPISAIEDSLQDLRRMVERNGPLPAERAVPIVRRAACALADGQIAGHYANTQNHVFWLGAVLFFALTGRAPLAPQNAAKSNGRSPLSPSSFAPHAVLPDLDVLVSRCLAENRNERFSSIIDLTIALNALPYAEESIEVIEGTPDSTAAPFAAGDDEVPSGPRDSGLYERSTTKTDGAPFALRLVSGRSPQPARHSTGSRRASSAQG